MYLRMNVISCLMYSQTNHLSPFCSKTYFLVRRQNLSPIAQNPACRRTCPFVGLVVRLHNPVGVDISDEDDEDDDDDEDDEDDEDAAPRCILMCSVTPVKGTFSVGAQTILMIHTLHHP